MVKASKEKKMKRHKKIYLFFLVLGLISIADIASRGFVADVFQVSDVGIFGLLIVSITQNPIIIGLAVVLLDFGLFLLIIALLERQTYKKLERELIVSQEMNKKA